MTSGSSPRVALLSLALAIVAEPLANAAPQQRTVLPPTTISAAPPASDHVDIPFAVDAPVECPCVLVATNGGSSDRTGVTNAWIWLDDSPVLAPPALTPSGAQVSVPLSLAGGRHVLRVRLAGRPESFIVLAIFGTVHVDDLREPRANHTATLLGDGSIFVAGGTSGASLSATTERFDPRSRLTTAATPLASPRADMSAVALPTGELWIAGGQTGAGISGTSELAAGTPDVLAVQLTAPRLGHTTTVLRDGQLWVIGGRDASGAALASVEIVDPRPDPFGSARYDIRVATVEAPRDILLETRSSHTTTLLPNGKLLVAGGLGANGPLGSLELIDPVTGSSTGLAVTLAIPREGHTATLQRDGSIVIAGGRTAAGVTSSIEIVSPDLTGVTTSLARLTVARADHTATLLATGDVLIAGGRHASGVLSHTELIAPGPDAADGPRAVASFPASGGAGVDRTTIVTVRFSAAVDPLTVTAATLRLHAMGAALAATVAISEDGLQAHLVPLSSLTAGTEHTIVIDGVRDWAGRPVTVASSTFITVAAPTITSIDPSHGPAQALITVTGTGFGEGIGDQRVTLGPESIAPQSAGPTELTLLVPATLAPGPYTLAIATRGGSASAPFTVDPAVPPGPTPTSLAIFPRAASLGIGGAQSFTATATFEDGSTTTVTTDATWTSSHPTIADVNASGRVTAGQPGGALITVRFSALEATASVDVYAGDPIPPDPALVAPPLQIASATRFSQSVSFLYEGENPTQRNVAPGAIEPRRTAVIRGTVTSREGAPLAGARVSVAGAPQLGYTVTRVDGGFELAVNGGGLTTVQVTLAGYLSAERQLVPAWQDFATAPTIVLVAQDPVVSAIDLANATSPQIARASVMADDDGTRQATLVFAAGTTATITRPDGTEQALSALSVRATEYTVGPNGARSMPAPLPAASGYTYAVEFSVDEAAALGADEVRFNQPVASYTDNFLGFPAGTAVPTAYYDRKRHAWIPVPDGRVIAIVGETTGLADLDVLGGGAPSPQAALDALGITAEERATLASLYEPGHSIWRVRVVHFSPYDMNWPVRVPDGADHPSNGGPEGGENEDLDRDDCRQGSIIDCQSQSVGEDVPIIGTNISLSYRSSRAARRRSAYTITGSLSGSTIPPPLKRIELAISIAGQRHTSSYPAQANQRYTFTWDGRDGYDRKVQGSMPATIEIGYVYDTNYAQPATGGQSFARPGTNAVTGDLARNEITFWQTHTALLGTLEMGPASGNGWSVSAHHWYDAASGSLYYGDGRRQGTQTVPPSASTAVGQGVSANGNVPPPPTPATTMPLVRPQGLVVDGDLSILFTNGTTSGGLQASYRAKPDGQVEQIAPASMGVVRAIGPDGTLYFTDPVAHVVRATYTDGQTAVVAGIVGSQGFSGDGGPATAARLRSPADVAIARDGTLYISDAGNGRMRRVGPDGIISTHAGGGFTSPGGIAIPALNVFLGTPIGIAVGPDDLPYIVTGSRVGRVTVDGLFLVVTGSISGARDVDVAGDGSIYVGTQPAGTAFAGSVFRIDAAKNATLVAGTGTIGENLPATGGLVNPAQGVAVGPDSSLYVLMTGTTGVHAVRRIGSMRPRATSPAVYDILPSIDGTQIFTFDRAGHHLETREPLTGAQLLTFAYAEDDPDQLVSITDRTGRVTRFEYTGARLTAIVAPGGQRTTIGTTSTGLLRTVTQPGGGEWRMTYNANGVLETFRRPEGLLSTFTYDDQGRLLRDENSEGASTTLDVTRGSRSWSTFVRTAEGREESFLVERLSTGVVRRTNTDAAGLQTITLENPSGTRTITTPDGTVINFTPARDPRFGLQSPALQELTIRTPSGLQTRVTGQHSTTLSNPSNLFGISNDFMSVNSDGTLRFASRNYDGATRRLFESWGSTLGMVTTLDAAARPTTVQVSTLTPTQFQYDAKERLQAVVQGNRSMTIAYDALDRPATLTDARQRALSFEYDDNSNVVAQHLPGGRELRFGYDTEGNSTSFTAPGRPSHAFTFTPGGRIASHTAPGGRLTTYDYNRDGQLTVLGRPSGQALGFGYDTAGRLKTLTMPTGALTYEYDTAGRLSELRMPGGATVKRDYDGFLPLREEWTGPVAGVVSRTYDRDFVVRTESVNGSYTVTYGYDTGGLRHRAGDLTMDRNGPFGAPSQVRLGAVFEQITYTAFTDNFGEVTSRSALINFSQQAFRADYTRDTLGRITRIVETIDGISRVFEYGYDVEGRLQLARRNGDLIAQYAYDDNNNRTMTTTPASVIEATYDDGDRLETWGNATFAYTVNGDLRSKTVDAQTTTYTYDLLGNLTGVDLADGRTVRYVVDARGRRVQKLVDGTPVRGWLWGDPLRPIAELDPSGAVVARFVYASRGTVPDFIMRGTDTFRIIADHLGSPRVVINTSTGEIVQRMDYGPFGELIQDSNPGFQPFGYAGGLWDADTGLVRFGARDYDPQTGRWTAEDPVAFGAGEANLYVYAMQDPINMLDPWGLQSTSTVATTVGGAATGFGGGLGYAASAQNNPTQGGQARLGGPNPNARYGWDRSFHIDAPHKGAPNVHLNAEIGPLSRFNHQPLPAWAYRLGSTNALKMAARGSILGGLALDAYGIATNCDTSEAVGGALGGWGGAAAGAAIGSAIVPGLGTAIGGLIGGVAGSGLGGYLGSLF